MELVTKKRLTIVSGRVNRELAEEVAERLGQHLGPVALAEFANGELHCKYGESIRGADLFIFGSHSSTARLAGTGVGKCFPMAGFSISFNEPGRATKASISRAIQLWLLRRNYYDHVFFFLFLKIL